MKDINISCEILYRIISLKSKLIPCNNYKLNVKRKSFAPHNNKNGDKEREGRREATNRAKERNERLFLWMLVRG